MKTFIRHAKHWRLANKNPNLTKKQLREIVKHSLEAYLLTLDKK